MNDYMAAARILVPRVPMMLRTAFAHSLWPSDTSSKWDLRTELIITTIRSIMSGSTSSISKQQEFGLKDAGVKGEMWISRVTLPAAEENDVLQFTMRVIDGLKEGEETFTRPELTSVSAEWTGYRAGVSANEPEPPVSEAAKYKSLVAETSTPVTILYFHGGAYYLMDPSSHRPTCAKLAEITGGRVLSLRYRLAPQHPFPAALLDALVAYLYLLYPPPGSFHEAVKPEHIVFAGDSAGGNLAIALLHLLLSAHQRSSAPPTVTFNGQKRQLPIPAGTATNSPWFDVGRSMPSLHSNARYDYLPPPKMPTSSLSTGDSPLPDPTNPHPCPLWPASPPRADLYVDGPSLCHPLVSPLAFPQSAWAGAPPMYVCVGEEMLSDEIRVVSQRCARAGVNITWDGFEAMPHCFAMMLQHIPASKRCFEGWGGWIRRLVVDGPAGVHTSGKWILAKARGEETVDVENLSPLQDAEVDEIMHEAMRTRNRIFEEYRRSAKL